MLESMLDDTGHDLKLKTFHKPTYCHHCSDLLWGLTNQGLQCSICGFVSHEKCQPNIVTPCNVKGSTPIQIPQAHTLVACSGSKKKYCAVCRLRIDNAQCFACEVCAYYIHSHCRKNIVHNCKIISSYTSTIPKKLLKPKHHWSEGHLPVYSKCQVCAKGCSSMDCLTGLRCSWCLNTVHSYCASQFNPRCDFGVLYNLILPPYAVKQFSSHSLFSKPTQNFDSQDSLTNDIDSDHVCQIFEGAVNNPTCWRSVSFSKDSIVADVLTSALKCFTITEDSSKYHLTGIDTYENEIILKEDEIFSNIYPVHHQKIFLRHQANEINMTIYAGNINSGISRVNLKISSQSSMNDIIKSALEQFQLKDKCALDFSITKMKLETDFVMESYFQYNESLYDEVVKEIESKDATRFYLQPKKEPMSEYSLYIGNLPADLPKDKYIALLSDALGGWEKDMNLEAFFPNNGAVVVSFNSEKTLEKLSSKLKKIIVDGKTLFSSFLSEIEEDYISRGVNPLLVLVNSKSGGGQGEKLLTTFKRLLNPFQVVDLLQGGPLPALYMFRNLREFRILICGGDGTFGWVLSSLDEISYNTLKCKQPASALLPLGTGNDLSRVLNWGAGYTGESPLSILQLVDTAEVVMFDRWNVVFDNPYGISNSKKEPTNLVPMNNYFSIGIDAELCLEFHLSREENPEKFSSRMHNKRVYFKAGLRRLTKSNMADLQNKLLLKVDGKECKIPSIQGLAIVNINSWGAGADPWGKDADEKFKSQSFSDGLLEVVGFTGVYHMGKIKSGLSTAIRIAQGTQIDLELKAELPVQVDGEPWLQPEACVLVRPMLHQAQMLVKCNDIRRRAFTALPPPPKKVDGVATLELHDSIRLGLDNWYKKVKSR